ncbi:response regulator [Paenarthrobacter sp. NPDC089675]|uniref:response regulator n=1 Tax=Paenarthrobacter sp. NPDC089675 TaxID=3364376 RepID=UPI0037F7A407
MREVSTAFNGDEVGTADHEARLQVVLIDDEELIRAGLGLILASEPDIEVVGESGDGRAGLETVAALNPDVVVMDIRMPVMDGVSATQVLAAPDFNPKRSEPVPVLILTTFNDDTALHAAIKAGASGFILKNSAPHILPAAIRALARGAGWLDPNVTLKILDQFTNRPVLSLPVPTEFHELTPRELEVLAAMSRGLNNSQIAQTLFLSESTVKTHVHRILMKLAITDRSQAVAAAYRWGLVKPDKP